VVALTLLAGCGEGGAPGVVQVDDPFCRSVLPRVQVYMDSTNLQHRADGDAQDWGTVVVGGLGEIPEGMNAFATSDYVANQHQQFVNLMTLVAFDEELELRPSLARSWELAPDGRSVTFHLRDDVVWHDGTPTTARDVAFTYRRITDPATGFPNAAFWDGYVTGDEGVEVLDEHTVRIHMRPHPEPLDPWRSVAILPEHLLGDVAPETLRGHPYGSRCPVGNGPFVFLDHREQDRWVFASNPGFPAALGGPPAISRYVYRVVPDANTLLLELLSGGVDVFISLEPDQAPRVEEAPDARLLAYPFRNVTFVAWNARRPPMDDVRVRRAFTLALDREAMVDALLEGYGAVAHGTVPPWHPVHDDSAAVLEHDPAAAGRLLDSAGWRDRDGDGIREDDEGRPLRLALTVNQGNRRLARTAAVIQDRLRAVGADVSVETLEWSAMVARITDSENRDFDAAILSWVTEFKLDDTDLFASDRIDGPFAFSGTSDPGLDDLLDSLRTTVDPAAARRLWSRYQAELARVQPYTFLYFPDRLDAVRDRVRNVVMDVRGEWVNVRAWEVDPR
jgi:peptide/nickel transport system substrate-binding protein